MSWRSASWHEPQLASVHGKRSETMWVSDVPDGVEKPDAFSGPDVPTATVAIAAAARVPHQILSARPRCERSRTPLPNGNKVHPPLGTTAVRLKSAERGRDFGGSAKRIRDSLLSGGNPGRRTFPVLRGAGPRAFLKTGIGGLKRFIATGRTGTGLASPS